jgi:hypothetical protein
MTNLRDASVQVNDLLFNDNQSQEKRCKVYKTPRSSSIDNSKHYAYKPNERFENHSLSYDKNYRRSSQNRNHLMSSSVQIQKAHIVRVKKNSVPDDVFYSCAED